MNNASIMHASLHTDVTALLMLLYLQQYMHSVMACNDGQELPLALFPDCVSEEDVTGAGVSGGRHRVS